MAINMECLKKLRYWIVCLSDGSYGVWETRKDARQIKRMNKGSIMFRWDIWGLIIAT